MFEVDRNKIAYSANDPPPPPPPTVGQQVELIQKIYFFLKINLFVFGLNVQILCGERGYIWKKLKFQKHLLKINFQQNFKFSKSIERFKSYNFFHPMYKKKLKNYQDVCWLEHDYMEMKMIVRNQSKNYFHLTPKIGPLRPPPPPNGILCT